MKTILVALGNPLRGDDGVARRVIELLGPTDAETVAAIQATPELADQIAGADRVIFIDADTTPGETRLEALAPPTGSPSPIGHSISPAETVELSRRLFGFQGEAWICRVPVTDCSVGEQLTPAADSNATRAAALVNAILR